MGITFEQTRSWRIINLTGVSNEDVRNHFDALDKLNKKIGGHLDHVRDLWPGVDNERFLKMLEGRERDAGRIPTMIIHHKKADGHVLYQNLKWSRRHVVGTTPLVLWCSTPQSLNTKSAVERVFAPKKRKINARDESSVLNAWIREYGIDSEARSIVLQNTPRMLEVCEDRYKRATRYTKSANVLRQVIASAADAYNKLEEASCSLLWTRRVWDHNIKPKNGTASGVTLLSSVRFPEDVASSRESTLNALEELLDAVGRSLHHFAELVPEEFISNPEVSTRPGGTRETPQR